MADQVPLVSYLVLGDEPHLEANACSACGALSFERRNACPKCGSDAGFTKQRVASTGVVSSFTIVNRAAPGVKVPFVSATVRLDGGGAVTANVVDTEPDPEHVHLGMKVQLTTFVVGTDDNGTEAVAFGFAPAA
jgi:uncharacterized OB-fold protein